MPDRLIKYGEAIRADDIEGYRGPDPALWLTGLARTLIQAELSRENLEYIVPQVTDRIAVSDGGVDELLEIRLELPHDRTPGLVNSGRTIYQMKWRGDRKRVISSARGQLAELRTQRGLPDVYVFVTNADLTGPEQARVRDALRDGCPEFPPDKIVVAGAAYLQDRVNMDPRVRVAMFHATGLSTWESAMQAMERRYRTGGPPPFQGRQRECEEVRRFVNDAGQRVMIVHGPASVGKTRLVLEAIAGVQDRVVCATNVPLDLPSLLQVLDNEVPPAVLVVDAPGSEIDAVTRGALAVQHLKTIIVTTEPARAPGMDSLAVVRFDQPTATAFIKRALPRLSYRDGQWLYDQLGGLPGLLLQGAATLDAVRDRDPLEGRDFGAIVDAFERTLVAPIEAAANVLEVLSLLPAVPLEGGGPGADIRLLCRVLDVNPLRVRADLDMLRARNFVELIGRPGYEVCQATPPLLARRRARRTLLRVAERVPELFDELSEYGRAGLVRRVAESAGEPALREAVEWLLNDAGIFTSPTGLAEHAACVVALAEALPVRTAEAVERALQGAAADDRHAAIREDAGRLLVHALTGLAHTRAAFKAAVSALLLLGETETQRWRIGAARALKELLHMWHPELPMEWEIRIDTLERLCEAATPAQRVVIAEAAGGALDFPFSVGVWQGATVLPPEPHRASQTWRPIQDATRRVIALLRRLSADEAEAVRSAAQRQLARSAVTTATLEIPEEGIQALEFLADAEPAPDLRAVIAESTAAFVAALRGAIQAGTTLRDPERTGPQPTERLEACAAQGEALFERITAGDFRARFFHWLGPSPMRAHRGERGIPSYERVTGEARGLAEDAIRAPELLTEDLLAWAVSEGAANAGPFLARMGAVDCGARWLPRLEALLPRMRAGGGLATYVIGWAESDAVAAGHYLDEIVGRGGNWSLAAAYGAWRLGPTDENAERLLKCVTVGHIHPRHVAQQLPYGGWPAGLLLDALLGLVRGLRDGSAEVDLALIEVLDAAWPDRRADWARLGPVAVEMLSNTAEVATYGEQHHWDALAAQLVAWNVDAGFQLLLAHVRDRERGPAVFLRFERAQLLHALSEAERPRLVRELLTVALSDAPRAYIVKFELPNLLHPLTDTPVLMEFVEGAGVETARFIARNLDAGQDGFAHAFESLAAQWGTDEEVRAGLIESTTMPREPFNDMVAVLRPRFAVLEPLCRHANPRVAGLAREAEAELRRAIRTRPAVDG